jgi:hypothetical protein
MKRKIFTHTLRPLFLLLLALLISYTAFAVDIVGFSLLTGSAGAATSGVAINYPGMGRVMNITGITSTGYSSNGQTCYGWNAAGSDAWLTNAFSTVGYITTAVAGQMKATTSGPRDFKAQYSLNGSSWTDVPNDPAYSDDNPLIVLTTSLADFKFRLPTACDNKSTVYVRWVQNGTVAVGGGAILTTSTHTASLKGVVAQSELFGPPTSQATAISIISVTPTTITVGCTPGSGNRRILKMNTSNSFTAPTDDYNPSANATYGSGQQVVYNGSGASVVITVTSSVNQYWFRYYDYNSMDALTRYTAIDESANGNPKLCALENIHTPTYSSIGLINATLGATISTPTTGTIVDRGIYWGTSPGINSTNTGAQEGTASGGVFTTTTAVDRGSTIYFKGYVENESGVILTLESSFNNSPIFTGTGNWETAARWNVNEVPGANGDASYGDVADSPTINGICTLTATNSCTNLYINSGRILNINPAIDLTVNGTLANNGGTAGLKLLSTLDGTGSLMHNTDNVNATVQRYISGTQTLTAKKYHLVSVPITDATYLSGVWLDSYLFTYVETDNSWFIWDHPTTNILQTTEGAMVFYPDWGATTYKTYSITGQLNNGTYSPPVAYSGALHGYNLVPNPYPSAINWNAGSGWTKANISGTIWGFSPTAANYGSWNGTTGTNSVTNIIPVGQAFFTVANGNSPVLSMDNSVRLHDSKAFLKSGGIAPNILHLTAAGNGGQDEIAVQFADDATNLSVDRYDAIKFYGDLSVPQLSSFTAEDQALLSITGIPTGESTTVVPLHLDMDYTGELIFTASALESFDAGTPVQLEDKQFSQLIDLRTNPVYTFNHSPADAADRFALHFGSVLGIESPVNSLLSKVIVSGHEIYLDYPVANKGELFAVVYDLQGRTLNQVRLNNSGHDQFGLGSSGVYMIKLLLPSGIETHKLVVL